ncbi:LuxR family maltose regulon positive regulatory protein [Humibacillus xanthopallidus]|uniref:LuxR family maltose regulon positive regulatory protein n=1 Tax=Humibacillus xanthopallidus TaxID=412689 RepID=A0A543HX19_9MICO|nr:LuxR family maltose regulon positive regulatory protein [Humibacillus xanthopallidus]
MAGSPAASPHSGAPARVLVETKLHAPPAREQVVLRERLLGRLDQVAGHRLTLLAAPAGYGKTSLLTAWVGAEAHSRPMAWLSLDADDNDASILWSYVLEALRRACPALDVVDDLASPSTPALVEVLLPRLVNALSDQAGVTLVLDDFHLLTDSRARASVRWLVEHAPDDFQLVVATRTEPDLGLSALRAHGQLTELRADDLRFNLDEADVFLNGRQMLGLSTSDVRLLVERTLGWPAGLYLAALSLQRAEDRHGLVSRFEASNRHVTDFLESEVLEANDPADQDLMARCAVLDRISGPLCDALTGQSGSHETLRRLARSNLFLTPLDDDGAWYRFHPLFAQLLRVQLERRHPGLANELHQRAFAWHRDRGDTATAINHALEAGLHSEAADLVAQTWYTQINLGRFHTVVAWTDRFPPRVLHSDVRLLLARAWALSASGQEAEAAESIVRVERLLDTHAGSLPDGFSSAEASLETLRGSFPWGNVREAHAHAVRALELEGPDSPWYPVARWGLAMADMWRGRFREAEQQYAEVIALANRRQGHWLILCASLAYCSMIAGEEGRTEAQARLVDECTLVAREHGLVNATSGPSMALGAMLNDRGRPAEALPVLQRGLTLARHQGQPLILLRTLRYLGDSLTMLGRTQEAAAVASEARMIMAACVFPAIDSPITPPTRRATSESTSRQPAPEPLTHRELTVLTLLAGKGSEADIGRELFVSHSTVHSHVRSIYRKLGAASRAEAVELGRNCGYLEMAVAPV